MSRLLLILFVPFAAVPLAAAPVPKHLFPKDPPLYYPTKVGTKWVYSEDGIERTLVVEAVERGHGGLAVTVATVDGGGRVAHEKVVVSPGGLARLVTEEGQRELLRVPHEKGDTWDYAIGSPELLLAVLTATAAGEENVTVPAGKFVAARVDYELTTPVPQEQKSRWTCWYALGVGLVKMEYDGKVFRALKSFTPGKD